jgi:hypothetical protein
MGVSAGPERPFNTGITKDGLVFWVDALDKGSYLGTGTTWSDLINTNHGTLTNGPVHNANGYFTFDGTNDYSTHGNDSSVQFTDNFSADIWVRPHTIDQDVTVFSRDDASNRQWWIFLQNNESIWWSFVVGNAQSPTGLYTANNWFHVCGTYDGSTGIIYVNGTARTTTGGLSGNISSGNAALNIGNRDNDDRHFDGDIACARLYNKALTAGQVLQNYNAQKQRFGI